ncbi:MAG TPA: hypothetical protein VF942_16230 [Acidimicrobiales bacterium]
MMVTTGLLVFGVLFCLLGTVVLAAIAFFGLRWLLASGNEGTHAVVGGLGTPVADRLE